jgi:hypothetical protein
MDQDKLMEVIDRVQAAAMWAIMLGVSFAIAGMITWMMSVAVVGGIVLLVGILGIVITQYIWDKKVR